MAKSVEQRASLSTVPVLSGGQRRRNSSGTFRDRLVGIASLRASRKIRPVRSWKEAGRNRLTSLQWALSRIVLKALWKKYRDEYTTWTRRPFWCRVWELELVITLDKHERKILATGGRGGKGGGGGGGGEHQRQGCHS